MPIMMRSVLIIWTGSHAWVAVMFFEAFSTPATVKNVTMANKVNVCLGDANNAFGFSIVFMTGISSLLVGFFAVLT